MNRRYFIITSLSAFAILPATGRAQSENTVETSESLKIQSIHRKILTRHPTVSHVNGADVTSLLEASEDTLIFDVREPHEHNVSHIRGAVQIDPSISAQDFMARFGDKVTGRNLILYCSVGRRASRLAERIQATALKGGAVSVQNIEGGLFRWHNEERDLISQDDTTQAIHPYNAWAGRLITRSDHIRYKPL